MFLNRNSFHNRGEIKFKIINARADFPNFPSRLSNSKTFSDSFFSPNKPRFNKTLVIISKSSLFLFQGSPDDPSAVGWIPRNSKIFIFESELSFCSEIISLITRVNVRIFTNSPIPGKWKILEFLEIQPSPPAGHHPSGVHIVSSVEPCLNLFSFSFPPDNNVTNLSIFSIFCNSGLNDSLRGMSHWVKWVIFTSLENDSFEETRKEKKIKSSSGTTEKLEENKNR